MKQILTLIAALLLTPSLGFAATLSSMGKDDVVSALSDKTIKTITAATLNDKVISDSFTGYIAKDGKMMGSFATKPQDEPQTDTGTWKVDSNGMFCFKWDHWNSAKEKCVAIYKLNNGLLVINKDNGFESMILSDQIKSGNQMSILAQ